MRGKLQVFGRIVDPEHFSIVTKGLRRVEEELVNESIGVLSLFHPDNPTGHQQFYLVCVNPAIMLMKLLLGSYDLVLGQQAHYTVARRLTELFCNQYENGLCKLPYETPIPYYNLDGKTIHLTHPRDIQLPKEGRLKVTRNRFHRTRELGFQIFFTDLRPAPILASSMDKKTFFIVLSKLNCLSGEDKQQLKDKASDKKVLRVVSVLQRFNIKHTVSLIPRVDHFTNIDFQVLFMGGKCI